MQLHYTTRLIGLWCYWNCIRTNLIILFFLKQGIKTTALWCEKIIMLIDARAAVSKKMQTHPVSVATQCRHKWWIGSCVRHGGFCDASWTHHSFRKDCVPNRDNLRHGFLCRDVPCAAARVYLWARRSRSSLLFHYVMLWLAGTKMTGGWGFCAVVFKCSHGLC